MHEAGFKKRNTRGKIIRSNIAVVDPASLVWMEGLQRSSKWGAGRVTGDWRL